MNLPPERDKRGDDPGNDRGVTLVQKPIQLAAAPADGDVDLSVYRGGVPPKLCRVAHTPTLGPGYVVLCHTRRASDINLTPLKAVA